MSIDNAIADADSLLNENSSSVAEEAENLMSLLRMSFTPFCLEILYSGIDSQRCKYYSRPLENCK